MSQSVINAIQRAADKRRRKLAQWWANQKKDVNRLNQIAFNLLRFNQEFDAGIKLESIPLLSPEPPLE
jgi:hypothetical protein